MTTSANPFQSRCRDWVVGESGPKRRRLSQPNCFSLVAEIGWLASWAATSAATPTPIESFSLVAEIGWLASGHHIRRSPC